MKNSTVRLLLFIFLCLITAPSFANDGVFYAQGNTLFPVKEIVVRMDKEVLELTRDGDYVNVSVYFELFNPGPEKEEIVGFITPPAGGDFPEEETVHPQISKFTAVMNGQELPYKVFVMEGSGFSLPDSVAGSRDFVYHFKARFKKGKNIIRHTYRFRASSSVETSYEVPYVITTGKMWAGGSIGDFTLKVDMGPEAYFTVPWSFTADGRPAPWTIEGEGRISENKTWFIWRNWRTVYLRKGILSLKEKSFAPDSNISVSQWHLHDEIFFWCDACGDEHLGEIILNLDTASIKELSDEDLRRVRNYAYARRGYIFDSRELNNYFSQFNWYLYNNGLKAENIELSEEDQQRINWVLEEEKRRKQH